jgi:hypothetical protein
VKGEARTGRPGFFLDTVHCSYEEGQEKGKEEISHQALEPLVAHGVSA